MISINPASPPEESPSAESLFVAPCVHQKLRCLYQLT